MDTMTVPSVETEERLAIVQAEAAERAATVGEFQTMFRRDAMGLLDEGADTSVVHSRIDVIAEAAKDQTHLALATTETNVLGQARLGAGDGGVVLSEQMFGTITTLDDALQAQHTGAHEHRHAIQKMMGDIVFQGDTVTSWQSVEGDAELAANTAVGMGMLEHREGQPEDYEAAQNVVYAMQQVVGRAFWTTVMTDTGGTVALQEKLDAAGAGRRETAQ